MTDSNTAGRSDRYDHERIKPPAEPIEQVVNGMPLTFDDLADYSGNWADHLAKLGWIEMGEAPKHTEIECLLRDGSTELVMWNGDYWVDRAGGAYGDEATVGWRMPMDGGLNDD